jgi:phosphomannomutase
MIRFITRDFCKIEEKLSHKAIRQLSSSKAFKEYKFPALLDADKVITLLPENATEEDCAKVFKFSLFSFMGTDGMRGKVCTQRFEGLETLRKYLGENLISVSLLELSALAFIRMLKEYNKGQTEAQKETQNEALKICFGNDSRDKATGWILRDSLINVFAKNGVEVINLDVIPTPYVPHYMLCNDIKGGAVLTASHNPSNQNGIKYFLDGKKLLSDGEHGDYILSAYMYEAALNLTDSIGSPNPSEVYPSEASTTSISPSSRVTTLNYSDQAVKFLENTIVSQNIAELAKCRIIIDTANGAWSECAVKFVSKNKINAKIINCEPEGENINHNCGVAEIEGHSFFAKEDLISSPEIIQLVYQEKSYGIAVDGDGDRGFVLKYDTEKDGVIVYDGDAEAYLIASLSKAACNCDTTNKEAVFTIESDLMVSLEMQDKFNLTPKMVDVGDKWICCQNPEEMSIGFESSGHVIIPCTITPNNSLSSNKTLLSGNGLLTAFMTIISLQKGNEPFEKGYSNTFYTYFVNKNLFYNGSDLWKKDEALIKDTITKDKTLSLKQIQMRDPNVLVFNIIYQGKICALLFSRNSGTEDKNAVYLKCRKGFEDRFLPLANELSLQHCKNMKDNTREEVICENKIMETIDKKGFAVKADLDSAFDSGIIESAFHALVKEKLICNQNDSYHRK